ncbi:hypothetical protein N0V82_000568 [Gnomoniopsis sp. IMI 355080]|nr:hypothetical protein N0V82_000568 [Gnomoniopsis sp. IMI 355080]
MTGRLRAILGGSHRVKKKKSSGSKARGGGNNNSRASPSSWSDSLPRTKASPGSESTSKETKRHDDDGSDDEELYRPNEPLPDGGLVHALLTDLTLRDVPQAMRFSHSHMFTPLPEQPSSYGLNSTRVADVLNFRRNLPRLTTTMHLHALLRSPTAVEREIAELVRAGTLRKIVILRRGAGNKAGGGVVEFLMEGQDLETRVDESALGKETKEVFINWLKANPAQLKVSSADIDRKGLGQGGLQATHVDQLVRAGFLTTFHDFDIGHVSSNFARPEDIGTMLSLQSISRAAAGSFAAVGGSDALHSSGGSGGARSGGAVARLLPGAGGGDLSLAVPGQGAYLKLLTAALTHLTTGLLGKASYKEMPEGLLRERWDGGVANESRQHAGEKSRREFAGVLPGRTRKWKEFSGLAFEWVLHEAVGAGLVEVFETGSVGRAVRLL